MCKTPSSTPALQEKKSNKEINKRTTLEWYVESYNQTLVPQQQECVWNLWHFLERTNLDEVTFTVPTLYASFFWPIAQGSTGLAAAQDHTSVSKSPKCTLCSPGSVWLFISQELGAISHILDFSRTSRIGGLDDKSYLVFCKLYLVDHQLKKLSLGCC